jgi:hypothetical protein
VHGAALLAAGVIGVVGAVEPARARPHLLDPAGGQVDALRNIVIWGRHDSERGILMRQVDGRESRIPGTVAGLNIMGPDLGLDRSGRVVIVYGRCANRCQGPFAADVRGGGRRRLVLPTRRGCKPGVTASVWRQRIAYALRCSDGGSGVYLARGDRVRRIAKLSHSEAKSPSIDLVESHVRVNRQIYSTGKKPCVVPFGEPERPDYGTSAIDLHPRRAWWIREQVGAYGGGNSELVRAAIGPGCRVRRLGEPLSLDALIDSQPPLATTLAVAGNTFYLDPLDAGVQYARLPRALRG